MNIFHKNWMFCVKNWVFFTKIWALLTMVGLFYNNGVFLFQEIEKILVIVGIKLVFFDNDWLFLDKN